MLCRRVSDRRRPSWRSTWQLLPAWLKQLECERWTRWESSTRPGMRREGKGLWAYRWTKEECWEGDFPNREMDFTRTGNKAVRKRQASWKQPLAEAATKTGSLAEFAARLHQLGNENALWLTTNEGPECVPLDDMKFRINARVRLDLPVIQQGLCQHQRRQKSDGTAGARCLTQLDEQGQHAQKCLIGGDRAKLHDVGLPHHTQRLL